MSRLILVFLAACSPYDVWCDPDTNLCWQDPQKDADDADDVGLVPSDAVAFCDALVLGGHDDWRLPTIDELRTLVRGSPDTEVDGVCPVTSGSDADDGIPPACLGGAEFEGPGPGGCYWPEGLGGTCDKPDPAVVGHPLETWAIDPAADDPTHWIAYVTFDTGAMGFNHTCSFGDVRCVRSDEPPPACELDGTPCVELLPTADHCDQDLTGEADVLALTLRVPEALAGEPHQLLAFLYEAEPGWYPPLGPPDGGTQIDQVLDPDLDVDQPLELLVHGTTYYREELLVGDYQLYVHLQMVEAFPPIPVGGDYVWGGSEASIAVPFDGVHQGTVQAMDLTLEPVSCPAETPVSCPDGSCAATLAECPASACDAPPDDAAVVTCRYESAFVAENCADFTGTWTEEAAGERCGSLAGAMPETVEVVTGRSCLVQLGGFDEATRCAVSDEAGAWFAYGTPEAICAGFLDGSHEVGPFCDAY